MAVKLTLPDGSTTDISTQTARLFVSSTPDGFVDLLKAMRPGPTKPLRMAKYVATHPGLLGALPVLRDANRIPASYATLEYHGLHAFHWVAADGSARFVHHADFLHELAFYDRLLRANGCEREKEKCDCPDAPCSGPGDQTGTETR